MISDFEKINPISSRNNEDNDVLELSSPKNAKEVNFDDLPNLNDNSGDSMDFNNLPQILSKESQRL